jgi:hypothetical protein
VRDRYGRVEYEKTGNGSTAPTVHHILDAGGLETQTDVYASADADLPTPSGAVQSTKRYFDRVGQLDSLIGPGTRTGSKTARKQSYLRDRTGTPVYEFPGNGSYIGRTVDWQGRVTMMDQSYVDPTRSMDGERFAQAGDSTAYASFFLKSGSQLSNGQLYQYVYDSKGRRTMMFGRENFLGPLTDRRWGYTPSGAVIVDTLRFQDGATVSRLYEYNRRGQRVKARSGARSRRAASPRQRTAWSTSTIRRRRGSTRWWATPPARC